MILELNDVNAIIDALQRMPAVTDYYNRLADSISELINDDEWDSITDENTPILEIKHV